ncbi:hypothetical protein M0R45_011991 [Rubus argutus]|uniref:Uncharacterized protein n=1 Tax=Rubus argutus TaxID=59490 RepID=A0AAW1YEA5_RUBAR
MIPRRYSGSTSKHRDLSNRVYASHEDRMEAMAKAEELESGLGSDYPDPCENNAPITCHWWILAGNNQLGSRVDDACKC